MVCISVWRRIPALLVRTNCHVDVLSSDRVQEWGSSATMQMVLQLTTQLPSCVLGQHQLHTN